jgi:CheY-like chemotaxis protein
MATVLIVEDQEQILMLAQSFLEEQGHKTLSAATADEALAILTGSGAVDALFVDIIPTETCRPVFNWRNEPLN